MNGAILTNPVSSYEIMEFPEASLVEQVGLSTNDDKLNYANLLANKSLVRFIDNSMYKART